ncbi:MAG: transcriptional regulator NrdR [Anaerolineae bacterium]
MKCPYCGQSDSRVIDTRSAGDGIRRRRKCTDCGKRFTTYERTLVNEPLVVKRDGRREDFSREKLLAGLHKACAKRPIASEDVERLADQVESKIQALGKAEIPSRLIGEIVLERLKELDEVAYIRFASVYLPLSDLESIKKEIDRFLEHR